MARKKQPPIEQEKLVVEEFMEIGGSPVPGITLRTILRGHTDRINRIAWSPDGRYLASPSDDKSIRIWDVERGECVTVLKDQKVVYSVAWSKDGNELASGNENGEIIVYRADLEVKNKGVSIAWKYREHNNKVTGLSWSPTDQKLASSAIGETEVFIWDGRKGILQNKLPYHSQSIPFVEWSPNGEFLASGTWEYINIFDVNNWTYFRLNTPNVGFNFVTWSNNSKFLASATSGSDSIHIWDVTAKRLIIQLEGHTSAIENAMFSADGSLLASISSDNSVRIWRTDIWRSVAILKELAHTFEGLAFHPHLPRLATLGETGTAIRIWILIMIFLLVIHPRQNQFNTPPPNSFSSAIRAWAKPGWAGGWRTMNSKYMPPRMGSNSG
jgi:WD40 repeat protein